MPNYEFKIADTAEELRQVYRLRYDVFCLEKGFYKEKDYPAGLLIDEFDGYSVYIVTKRGSSIITAARLTPYRKDKAICFPALRFVSFPENFYSEKTFEMSSGVVKKEYRRTGIGIRSLGYIYETSKRMGIKYLLAISNEDLYKIFRRTKLPFVYVGDPVNCEGFVSFPFVCEVREDAKVY